MILRLIFAVAALAGLTAAAPADPLERSAPLLISLVPPDAAGQAQPGVAVATVAPGGTAERIGLKAGDRLLAVNGVTITDAPSLTSESRKLRANKPIALTVLRDGRRVELRGRAVGRPLETHGGATVRYGAVPFEKGWLRDIYVAPTPDYSGPVLWYIQG